MNIVLNAGHGAGKEYNRGGVLFNEGDETFNYSLLLKDELLKYENVDIKLIRNKVTDDPPYYSRGLIYQNVDLFISIHSNAFNSKVKGSEIFLSVKSIDYLKFANDLLSVTSNILKTNNRGVKIEKRLDGLDDYAELRNNNAKVRLICENFFHTNLEESKIYLENKKTLAKEQAKVIAKHFNLIKKSDENVLLYKVVDPALNIRKYPCSNSEIVGKITDYGVYTITEISGDYGKLKSGKGFIYLPLCEKI